jgi:uncharacterized phiE125 gp8 family phage protein
VNCKIITPVATEPVSLAEARQYVKFDLTDAAEDTFISSLITAAREYCEAYTRRALATQTLEAYLDWFPCADRFELPCPPLQSVTSVKYKDSDGTETTMTVDTDYLVDADSTVGQIVRPYGVSWPSFTPHPIHPIKVRFTAGYAAPNTMPKLIKQAMLLYVGFFYYNRDAVELSAEMDRSIKSMLTIYRIGWF